MQSIVMDSQQFLLLNCWMKKMCLFWKKALSYATGRRRFKGSPEAISRRCKQASLPESFGEKARQSARDGIYQLAMATPQRSPATKQHQK